MQGEITRLLELQAMDLKLTELSFEIKRLAENRASIEQKIADERARFEQRKAAHAALEHESRMRNLDVDELDDNIRGYQQRLDTGIISFKEMEDLRAKIASDRTRIERMEDAALALMDEIESSKAELLRAESALGERIAHLNGQAADLEGKRQQTEAGRTALVADRQRAAEATPGYLVSQYESLRAEFSEPIAAVNHGTCAGCKLKLSGSTVERVRGGLGVVTCEHCNRILYVD